MCAWWPFASAVNFVVHIFGSRPPICMYVPHAAPSPALFDLAAAKAKVSKAVEDTAPGQFKHFYASQLFDRMVTSCLIYFVDKLQLTTLSQVCYCDAVIILTCNFAMLCACFASAWL